MKTSYYKLYLINKQNLLFSAENNACITCATQFPLCSTCSETVCNKCLPNNYLFLNVPGELCQQCSSCTDPDQYISHHDRTGLGICKLCDDSNIPNCLECSANGNHRDCETCKDSFVRWDSNNDGFYNNCINNCASANSNYVSSATPFSKFSFLWSYIKILIFFILFLKLAFVVPRSLIALNARAPLLVQLVSRTFSKAALDSVSYVM